MTESETALEPIHPGEVLREDFMAPLRISINGLARELRVPPGRISAIVGGKRAVTADTALRLARYLDTTPQFWMNLQAEYELRMAQREAGAEIERGIQPRAG